MHSGKIKKVVGERGFGFINDTDGREVFFHQSGLVEFEIENSPKGPRAVTISIVKE